MAWLNAHFRVKPKCGTTSKYQPSGAGVTRSPPKMPHHLQNPKQPLWDQKWLKGSGKVSTPRFFGPCQPYLNKFFDRALLLWEKVPMEEGKNEKNDENSGHYLIASNWLPDRRPTGTQHACANIPNTFSLPNQEKSENLKKTLKLIHISTSEHL